LSEDWGAFSRRENTRVKRAGGIEALPAVSEQLHRALQVGEEDSDLLALTFEGALGREDLLGEVLRSVRLGTGEAARPIGGERRTAGPAEFLAGRDRGATARTGRFKPGAIVLAEARASVVLSLAPGTLQTGALQAAGPAKVGAVEED
jgi:hypothetical protein